MSVQVVSPFESRLLQIVHGFLGRAPWERVSRILQLGRWDRPTGLSSEAVELLQDTLAKGCVRFLAGAGWRRERFLSGDSIVEGRLWQRWTPDRLALTFSPNALDFLMWCTATRVQGANARWRPRRGHPLTLGDRLLLFLAYRAARHSTAGDVLRRQPVFLQHGLCRLAFPEDFAGVDTTPIFDEWASSPACAIVEALQDELTATWLELEQRKSLIRSPAVMLGIATSQDEALAAFRGAANAAGRRDLLRFLLDLGCRLLRQPQDIGLWTASLEMDEMRLAERMEVYHAALAVPRALLQLESWQREAVAVGYTDEGYAASQLWKSDWELFQADAVCRNARALLRPRGNPT